MLDIREIEKILPHRYPLLLVDRILSLDPGKKAVGIKNVTINEYFFTGHFPNFPIMPGVLIVEAMAQVGGIILLGLPQCENKSVLFGGINRMRFRKPVLPGDQLHMEVEVLKIKGNVGKMWAKATVDDEIAAEGEILFSLTRQNPNGTFVHPTASVHRSTQLGSNVHIGPNVTIGPEVVIGDNTKIEAGACILKWTHIGNDCHIHVGAVLGNTAQDLKYQGEKTLLSIGDRNTIREYATINLASGEGETTSLGNDNFIMANAHVAHNCHIGNEVILGNFAGITGHVHIEDQAIIGGLSGIHQFTQIGRLSMIGGMSKITQDVLPFSLVDGNPARMRGANIIGLERRNIPKDTIEIVKQAIKLLCFSGKGKQEAIAAIEQLPPLPEKDHLLTFATQSKRGFIRKTEEGSPPRHIIGTPPHHSF